MKCLIIEREETEDGVIIETRIPKELLKYFTDGYAIGWLQIDDNRLITADQRKKLYALFKDIALHTGHFAEEVKDILKTEYIATNDKDYFSLSNADQTTASDFIDFIIEFCFKFNIPFKTKTADLLKDLERWSYVCLKYRKCCICGKNGEIHHVDTIGMGNDRKTLDDSDKRKLCLCRTCHTTSHTMSLNKFLDRYKVRPILYKEVE